MIKKKDILESKQGDHVLNELSTLKKIKSYQGHPFCISLDGITQNEKYLYISLELVNGGEFFSYLRGIGKFPVEQTRFYISQIISALEFLHSKNIIYRDLRPENILIQRSGYIKLSDFSYAKEINGRTYTLCGTPEYLAPEVILNKGYGKSVDFWCLGILLYELLAGIDPFSDDDPIKIYEKILEGKIKFPSGFDDNAKSLVKHLLEKDLSKRYGNLQNGINDIKKHRFFNEFDWEKLLNEEINPPYHPKVKSDNDITNFSSYPDSDNETAPVSENEDPFLENFK
jgi:protein kinase A